MEPRSRIICCGLAAALALSLAGNLILAGRLAGNAQKTGNGTETVPVIDKQPDDILRITGSGFESWTRAFRIQFDRELADYDLTKMVEVEPAVEFTACREGGGTCRIYGEFQPGNFYRVTLRDTLAGVDGARLPGQRSLGFIASDLDSDLRFLTRGSLYPVDSAVWSLPVRITNPDADKVRVTVGRAYRSTLPNFFANPDERQTEPIREFDVPVRLRRNEPTPLDLDLREAGIPRTPGIYLVSLGEYSWWGGDRQRIVVVTDLALQAVRNRGELLFALRTLSGGTPVSGAEVTLYSAKMQKLAETNSDAEGFGRLDIPTLRDRKDYPALLLARQGDDCTYLKLSALQIRSEQPTAAAADAELRAFLFPERGICRPGETIALFGMLRDGRTLEEKGNVPAEFVVTTPAGKLFTRLPATGDSAGFYRAGVKLPPTAATGTYRVVLRPPGADSAVPAFGATAFSVGEYVPDQLRIRVAAEVSHATNPVPPSPATPAIAAPKPAAAVPQRRQAPRLARLTGNVGYYFGMPLRQGALNFSAEGQLGHFTPKGYPDFTFGYASPDFRPVRLTGRGTCDDAGNFSAEFELPEYDRPPALPVIYRVSAFARGAAGGRGVTGSEELTVHYADFYLGTKVVEEEPDFQRFELVALTPREEPLNPGERKFRLQLNRLEWNYVTRELDNRLSRVWQQEAIPVRNEALELDNAGRFTVRLPAPGRYQLAILDTAGNTLNSIEFWHNRGEAGSRAANPAVLSFELDRENYRPGDTARLTFLSPVSGNGVIVSGGTRLGKPLTVKVRAGRNTIELPVPGNLNTGNWFAGITVVGRAGNDADPLRLFGLAELEIDQNARRLDVTLDAPPLCRPGGRATLSLTLRAPDGKPVPGRVQLWAVDAGVLALTGFKTPDPFRFFFGQSGCPFEFGDAYPELYPQLAIGRRLIGGGDKAPVYFAGDGEKLKAPAIVLLDATDVPADGRLKLELPLPNHTGALRLMAVASAGERAGAAETDLVLRDEISLQITAPRFVAPGDEFEVLLEGMNHELEASNGTWDVTATGTAGSTIQRKGELTLVKGVPQTARIRLRAPGTPGEIRVSAALALGRCGAGDEVVIPVRSPFPAVETLTVSTVAPGEKRDFQAPEQGSLEIGSPVLAVTGALEWLNNYPYGCVEQTAAGAFPFLAVKPLIRAGVIPAFFAEDADHRLRDAIARIETMRLQDGAFAMWPGERRSWGEGSLFVFHFLLEADSSGIPLEPEYRRSMIRFLQKYIEKTANPIASRAYAAYVLALADPANAGAYARLVLSDADGLFERFLGGAALIRANSAAEGMQVLEPLLKSNFWRAGDAPDGFHSQTRRLGLSLWILTELLPDSPANPLLARELGAAITPAGNWGSTQENAWAVLGLSRYAAREGSGPVEARITVDGRTEALSGCLRLAGKIPAVVENRGRTPVYVYTRARILPKTCEPFAAGFTIRREYLNTAGRSVTSCETGDLLEVRLTITADAATENVVICDLLPGGLEIEDERLATRSATFASTPENRQFSPRAMEKRFDRFVAFGDFLSPGTAEVRYRVRATVRGKFALPPSQIEAMYQPGLRATAGAGDGMFLVR